MSYLSNYSLLVSEFQILFATTALGDCKKSGSLIKPENWSDARTPMVILYLKSPLERAHLIENAA